MPVELHARLTGARADEDEHENEDDDEGVSVCQIKVELVLRSCATLLNTLSVRGYTDRAFVFLRVRDRKSVV